MLPLQITVSKGSSAICLIFFQIGKNVKEGAARKQGHHNEDTPTKS